MIPLPVHVFPPLLTGKLVRRYQRFFADIELPSGETITAHCPNTGPMTGICTIGSPVWVSVSNNPQRKLPYTWEMIEVEGVCIGVNTNLPNRVIRQMLCDHVIAALEPYADFRPEVAYGQEKSRIDFLLRGPIDTYVEVKNTTWSQGTTALFPDTVTTRGQKHLRELISIVQAGKKAALIYFINRGDCDRFAPGDSADREYGDLFRAALAQGVQMLPCRFTVSPEQIEYQGLAPLAEDGFLA